MEKRKIEEIKQGDVISLDNGRTRHTFNHKCMRQHGRWEVYTFGEWKSTYIDPDTMVCFYGKCDNVNLWGKGEKEVYAFKVWNEIKSELPAAVASTLGGVYGGRLFGKRGRYALQEKEYLVKNYKHVEKLREALKGHKGIVDAEVKVYEDIENLDYSIAMETECYGYRNYHVTLVCGDGEKVFI